MKKLLKWHDSYTLKILICFLILFTALYPKLPSIHIVRTWVYIRLEDFFILGTVIIWFIQVLRKKVTFPLWPSGAILAFWIIGLVSVINSIFFIGPQLANYFPHLAFLQYLRRIEYMVLFFVALSTVKSSKDIRDYFVILSVTLVGIVLYGLGQRYYLYFWEKFPDYFRFNSFCFPSFQTGNEEFAKGVPLCLPEGARIPSTFGGHYDLAAYLVLILPIFIAVGISVKRWLWRIVIFCLYIAGLVLMILTASRTSYLAYLVAVVIMLIFYKKKLFIIPVLIISIVLLLGFSESTAKRFLSTFRISSVVTNSQGQLVGEALPEDLKNRISKTENPPPAQNLQGGSAFIGFPSQSTPVATSVAMVKKTLTPEEAKRLQLANGSLEISTVSGAFLVRKVLVYDISFTTRFQAEWPNAAKAFLRNPFLGSGYSSITLATDNDYMRALGETGLLGFLAFVTIFLILGITLHELGPPMELSLSKGFIYGVAGGFVGLALNATLIDVFEASKVAENLWILLGIALGGLLLHKQKTVAYEPRLLRIVTSNFAIGLYLLFIACAAFLSSVGNFFVADDFTWLKWAASSTTSDLAQYFTNAQNFFYRPLDKTIVFFLYNIFAFLPEGYHIFNILLHFVASIAVYFIAKKLLKNNFLGFLSAFLFLLLPAHQENLFWFSTMSVTLSAVFILYAFLSFMKFRQEKSNAGYIMALLLSILAFLSYEIAVVAPFLFIAYDLFIGKPKKKMHAFLMHIPFLLLIPLYYFVRVLTHSFSGGGDYNYNIPHLLPNMIGNFFGYMTLFVGGENALPLYNSLRENFRDQQLIFVVLMLLFVVIVVIAAYAMRKKLANAWKNSLLRIVLFGIVFASISLLPFLGLGNIAPRYLYLGSFGMILSFIAILQYLTLLVAKDVKRYQTLILLAVVLIIGTFYQSQNINASHKWKKAGEITKGMLAEFRIEYEGFSGNSSNLYFINLPVTYNGVWVFPVGLEDSLWFIYQDRMPHVHRANSLKEARTEIMQKKTKNNHVFIFDSDGKLHFIKNEK